MPHAFPINFDPRPKREERTWRLDVVITPIDDFTGRVIMEGVTAEIPRQRVRAGHSLSGHLVFERLHSEDRHVVHIDAEAAGYFKHGPVTIDMPQERDTRIVRLIQRPDAVVDGASMVVRGSVVRQGSGQPVEGQVIEGRIAGIIDPFTTLTNSCGNFALRLRPPAEILNSDRLQVPVTADVTLKFVGAAIPDMPLSNVVDMRTRILDAEVEIP